MSCAREPSPPTRFEVSGIVTYEDEPVPFGMVVFEDVKTLYRTACSIENGHYKSQPGKGHQGGNFRVEITAFEDQPEGGLLGSPLWEGMCIQEAELPERAATKDFDLHAEDVKPASRAAPVPADGEPAASEPSATDEPPEPDEPPDADEPLDAVEPSDADEPS